MSLLHSWANVSIRGATWGAGSGVPASFCARLPPSTYSSAMYGQLSTRPTSCTRPPPQLGGDFFEGDRRRFNAYPKERIMLNKLLNLLGKGRHVRRRPCTTREAIRRQQRRPWLEEL